uniref:Uncharacterized protein n=1 Tax=Acinetobacter baumannii TaxID=470 RepID=A0A482F3J8_ACIBA|nr:hypothetical protein [Acinetobacter baumannii]QBN23290.1 hypothetical protein [Acinetobacter baumannii]
MKLSNFKEEIEVNKKLSVLILCCGSATGVFAKDEKSASLNEVNPITRYVNVCQQPGGNEKKFVLCDSKDKSCAQPEDRTVKHLATAK